MLNINTHEALLKILFYDIKCFNKIFRKTLTQMFVDILKLSRLDS